MRHTRVTRTSVNGQDRAWNCFSTTCSKRRPNFKIQPGNISSVDTFKDYSKVKKAQKRKNENKNFTFTDMYL